MVSKVKKACPQIPLVLYVNGNGGLLEHMKGTGVDVIGLDWTVDMEDGRRRLGDGIGLQGNVDPAFLFSPLPALTDEIQREIMHDIPYSSFTCYTSVVDQYERTCELLQFYL
ncbi:hypothetical protein AMTR_s00014p00244010 [Amborella trichopoda]|uniref:Uroporphyrinogen decarboxylase (URO-D) domain-containing protein n=1 Tax=Amborella trichopoda TaxID=13333 RepID=W1PPU0_AMBTC|nr:hypothetical protein AMTR_s00014p00244010 [Amborella trichopoda]